MPKPTLAALERYVTKWGGRIKRVTDVPGYGLCPFRDDMGVNWEEKTIFFSRYTKVTPLVLSDLIHEAGHVFACLKAPKDYPVEDAFLGWEWALARKLGIRPSDWKEANGAYRLGPEWNQLDIGDLSSIMFPYFLDFITKKAKDLGLVNRLGNPVPLR